MVSRENRLVLRAEFLALAKRFAGGSSQVAESVSSSPLRPTARTDRMRGDRIESRHCDQSSSARGWA